MNYHRYDQQNPTSVFYQEDTLDYFHQSKSSKSDPADSECYETKGRPQQI